MGSEMCIRDRDEDIVLTDAQTFCNLGLCLQMLVFTMHGYCVLRMDQGIDQLDLFLAGMSGYMSILENNICPLLEELVDHMGNCFFISRDRVGTEDHGIARQDRDLFVQVCRHTGQCCHGLALASGGDQELEKDPDLKSRVDDYRIRNYRLQQSENVDLYDAVDSLERDSYALRKSEKANAYLEAELEVCKMVQKVQDRISEAIRIGVPEI